VFAATAEIGYSTPDKSDQEDERGKKEHNNIAEDMEGVAPDIETPMSNCGITHAIFMCSGLPAEREEKIVVRTALHTFKLATVAAVSHAALMVGSIARQGTRRHLHWGRIGYGVDGHGHGDRDILRHGHRPALGSSIVVVDIVGDIDHDVACGVMHSVATRAGH